MLHGGTIDQDHIGYRVAEFCREIQLSIEHPESQSGQVYSWLLFTENKRNFGTNIGTFGPATVNLGCTTDQLHKLAL
jgi:hypothetical protein